MTPEEAKEKMRVARQELRDSYGKDSNPTPFRPFALTLGNDPASNLTKREHIAIQICVSTFTQNWGRDHRLAHALLCVESADLLIAALNGSYEKEEQPQA